jgi:hypothetical protein
MNQDFRDMLCALKEAGADHLLVGAYAMAVHGVPRATGDIDIWVRPTPENAERVWRALQAFGAPMDTLSMVDLSMPDIVIQIGVPPRRIDVLTGVSGLTFDEAWRTRLTVDLEGIELPVLGREALLRNKRASGRPKDLADLALLEEAADRE